MLAQVVEELLPGVSYTSSDDTWENVIFDDNNVLKPSLQEYEYTLYKLTNVEAIQKMREERNVLLDQSDKYMLDDFPQNDEGKKQLWMDYRRAIRDLPMTARPTLDEDGKLKNVEWPTVPTPSF
tara:strand:- start:84 stop:455 length:372 start_codon:yes stop_codon:yes gene_type:complete